jgi:hypothetical protein
VLTGLGDRNAVTVWRMSPFADLDYDGRVIGIGAFFLSKRLDVALTALAS